MFDQSATAVLEAPELVRAPQSALRVDADTTVFDPFDVFDADPTDQRLDPCEFGTA